MFLVVEDNDYQNISEISISNAYLNSINLNDLYNLLSIKIDLSSIPQSHGNNFNSLSISQCTLLEELSVIGHNLASIDLSSNINLEKINVSKGYILVGLNISNWNLVKQLDISECRFTSESYSTAFIDNVITTFNSVVPNPAIGYSLKYGINHLLGIRPSYTVKSSYDSLVSKGVLISGREPVAISSSTLTLTPYILPTSIELILNLTNPLSGDVNVRVQLDYFDDVDGLFKRQIDDVVIWEGQTEVHQFYDFPSPISSVGFIIRNVSPNPVGGIVINY